MKHETEIPRPEYPRPQFEREDWLNLNGQWTYTFDPGQSGRDRGFARRHGFDHTILVPFCPESKLSGVQHTDFIEMMWYHRKIAIPSNWRGRQIYLRFGAVDYECEVFIDGQSVGRHWGGTSSFGFDVTRFVADGAQHDLVLWVRDETRSGVQPAGKQCPQYFSRGCHYTRTTGIWQTVWMEPVSLHGLESLQIIPDVDDSKFSFIPTFHAQKSGVKLKITLLDEGEALGEVTTAAVNGTACEIVIQNPRLWSPEHPFLYAVKCEVIGASGEILDRVKSYAGLRKVHIENDVLLINNTPCYLRFVLDQGFYPDGIWTAPSDAALKRDIELSMQAGFNGARLHQKVFEERFHFWADKLGYLTWGESSSWGIHYDDVVSARNFLSEWREIVTRDRNHPSIIAWTPFNETSMPERSDWTQHHRLHIDAYDLTRSLDPVRPINDTSGYVHVKTDLFTVHHYEQRPEKLRSILEITPGRGVFRNNPEIEVAYAGQPYIIDEFGGIKWIPSEALKYAANSWGYGDAPKTEAEFYGRLEGLVAAILALKHIRGYCYTQLTDVEQEQNGIYNYDRSTKLDMKRVAAIFSRRPEWQ